MQKKLIALTVAALASGAALAQSNVQIYGVIDVGVSHRGDNANSDVGGKNSIDSGISSGNRLGFKGAEDLGNGLTALFVLENGFAADTGVLGQSGRLFGRQAYAGLTGNFGTVIAGRLYAPHYSLLSSIDPFKSGTVGQYRNVFAAGLTTLGENLFDPTRVDNAIAYVSPSFGGFNVTAAYSTNALATENLENRHDNTVIALLPRYTNGPIDVGVSYHRIKDDDDGAGILGTIKPKITNWAVGGTYDFKVVKLHAFYDKNKLSVSNPGWNDITLKSWLLGATVPFGKHAIQASFTQSKLDDQTDASAGKSKQYAVGYTYALSKRTNFYAAYSDISNDNEDGGKANKVRRVASTGDSSNGGDGYQNGLNIGLRHTF
ncbi:MAG: porin [Zoogloeaceae bacterium]|jgi:predicted porin|nr:porin [Zoogloeaceae bacterium]